MKPVVTEKAVMMVELSNILTFQTSMKKTKSEIKKIRTLIRDNKKYAYVKLKKEFPAIDLATKLGII